MYFVREGMGILRKFDDYDEAFKRYSDSKKSLDDVELYKVVSSNLCECMQSWKFFGIHSECCIHFE